MIPLPLAAQQVEPVSVHGDSVSIRLVDVDIRGAVQALSRYMDRPVIFGAVSGGRVTLETPLPVPREAVTLLLRGVLESQNLRLIEEAGFYHVREAEPESGGMTGDRSPHPPGVHAVLDLQVIPLRHARAADVAATVNALYGRASALGELGARPQTLTDELRQSRVPAELLPPDDSSPRTGRSATLSGEVTIVPDTRTNSLLIRSGAADFELIRAAVEYVDVRPLQVLIEVLIAEVRRDRGFSLGLETTLPLQRVPGTTSTTVEGTSTGLGLGDFALHIMKVGAVELDFTLRAAASRGDASILSRPVLLTANNEEAQILVGSQRPFVQVQRALPTDAPLRDQVVQYKDVGTHLTVRPTISADGYVMLEVKQEVNAATTEIAFDAPVISTRAVQTQLLIRDGQTAVLGGLTDRQLDVSRAGVPILSGLPLIGWAFGRSSRRTTETELFIFLTPRVIRDDAEMDEASSDVREGTRHIRKQLDKLLGPPTDRADPPPSGRPDRAHD